MAAPQAPRITLPTSLSELISAGGQDAITATEDYINALMSPAIRLGTPDLAGGGSRLTITRSGAEYLLALRWPNGVPADLSGGASLGDVITAINQIFAGERAIQSPIGQ